jgi:hypothetical protein
MSTRAIASMGTGSHERLLKIARHSFAPYAKRYGYDLHMRTEVADRTRPPVWSKIPILRDLIDRYELVVWLDSDAVIVDSRRDLASVLEPDRFFYIVEHAYNDERNVNAGIMMLRSGDMAAKFLDEAWNLRQYIDHEWAEQAAIMHLLGYDVQRKLPAHTTPYLEHTKLISPRWNSTFFAPARRPRIRHFAAWPERPRVAAMLAATAEAAVRRRTGH